MNPHLPVDAQHAPLFVPTTQSVEEISWSPFQIILAIIGLAVVGGLMLGLVYAIFLGLIKGLLLGTTHGLLAGCVWSVVWYVKWS